MASLLLALGALAAAAATSAAPASRPNILMMLVVSVPRPETRKRLTAWVGQDDLGFGSLQYNNPQGPRTPAIDALLATSIRLDRAYAYKFCSPSRCSLLSGRLPIHVNTDNDAVSPSLPPTRPPTPPCTPLCQTHCWYPDVPWVGVGSAGRWHPRGDDHPA